MKLIFSQMILHYLESADIVHIDLAIDSQGLEVAQRHWTRLLLNALGHCHTSVCS
jgi:hypothetical protein